MLVTLEYVCLGLVAALKQRDKAVKLIGWLQTLSMTAGLSGDQINVADRQTVEVARS